MKNSIRNAALLFAVALICFGCATTKPLTISKEELSQRLNNSIIHVAASEPSSFEDRARNMSGGLFGALGASVDVLKSISKGSDLAKHLNLTDPSLLVKNRFHDILKVKQSTTKTINHPNTANLNYITKSTPQEMKGMLFLYKTSLWGLFCYPKDCEHARLGYEVQAELYNQVTSSKIWASKCNTLGADISTKHTKKELLDNSGKKLKEEIINAANYCANLFEKELFTNK